MEFPTIPESLTELSDTELGELRTSLSEAGLALVTQGKTERLSAEQMEQVRTAKRVVSEIDAETAARQADADELAEAETLLAETEDEVEDESVEDLADASAPDDDEEGDDDGDDDGDEVEDAVTASAAPPARRRRAKAGELNDSAPPTPAPPATPDELAQVFTAVGGQSGITPGAPFETMEALGKQLLAAWGNIDGGAAAKIAVAQVEGRFDERAVLQPGTIMPIDPSNPESVNSLTAGFDCVPREPIYGPLGCGSSLERPVAGSLGTMKAPRGGYSVYPSPRLADVSDGDDGDGTGIWDRDDDGNPAAVKNACAVIPCGTPDDYDIYGVYRCLTVRHLHNITHPELVSAYINKLGALFSRLAESTLLNSMLASPNVVNVTKDLSSEAPLSANVRVMDFFLEALSIYREQERYSSVEVDTWLPRHVQTLLIRDWLRRSNNAVNSPQDLIASVGDLNSMLSDAGTSIVWTLDVADEWDSIAVQGDGELVPHPSQVDGLFSPRGNFKRLDEGVLQVGVTNRQPWDLDDMRRNQFTMFWEIFEGVIDMGCPSWAFSIGPVCPTGIQYAGLDPSDVTCEDVASGDLG